MKVVSITRWHSKDKNKPTHEYRFSEGKIVFEIPQEVRDEPGYDWYWEAKENMEALIEAIEYDLANSLTSPNNRIRRIANAIVNCKKHGTIIQEDL